MAVSSLTRMTPCLEEAYDNLFGSGYNDKVNKFCCIQKKLQTEDVSDL